jgi:hypothetical protein
MIRYPSIRLSSPVSGLLTVGCVLLAAPAVATDWQVTADGTGDMPTIEAAGTAAAPGDTITLADGTFTGTGNRDLSFAGKPLLIRALNEDPTLCVIDAEGSASDPHRVFYFHSAEDTSTVVRGITITGGCWEDGGAVWLIGDASPRFHGCRFVANEASDGHGGAVFVNDADGAPRFVDCVFEANVATLCGGAVGGFNGALLAFQDCEFVANAAAYGGGAVWLGLDSTAAFAACTFTENDGGTAAGAVRLGDGTFTGCSFVANTGDEMMTIEGTVSMVECEIAGHTIRLLDVTDDEASPILERCVVRDNVVQNALIAFAGDEMHVAGSLFHDNGPGRILSVQSSSSGPSLRVSGSTFSDNTGTAIAVAMGDMLFSQAFVENCVITDNDRYGIEMNGYGPYGGCYCSCTDIHGNGWGGDWDAVYPPDQVGEDGNLSADPLYCDQAARDYTLDSASPCAPDANPDCGLIGAFEVGCGDVSPATDLPEHGAILSCAPNPFNPRTTLTFTLDMPGPVRIDIVDGRGRHVRSLLDRARPAGPQAVIWDGRDDLGHAVSSGLYLARMRTGRGVEVAKLALIR